MKKILTVFLILMLLPRSFLSSCSKAPEHGPLTECFTSTGGGMDGGYSRAELSVRDGQTVLRTSESRYWNAPSMVCEYRADDDALDQLKEIIVRYGMTGWDDLPYSEFIALDAPTTSYSLVFDDSALGGSSYASVSFSLDQKLPGKGSEGVRALSACLRQWAQDGRLIDRRWEDMEGEVLGRIPADAGPEAAEALERLLQSSRDFRGALMDEGRHFTYEGTQDVGGAERFVFALDTQTPEYFAAGDGWSEFWRRDGSGNWVRETT